jgi:hypothetical protein
VKRLRVPALAITAFALVAVTAASALAAHSASFKASFSGTATEKVSGPTVNATAKGSGTANLLGKSTITGSVTTSTANPPCGPISGPGKIAGAKGTLKVNVLPSSKGCAAGQDDQNNISLSGTVQVKGGTGKFAKAKGNLHFSGHYDRGSGAFTVKLTGPVSY